jgi:DNA-binding MarR family transcriptional regulator
VGRIRPTDLNISFLISYQQADIGRMSIVSRPLTKTRTPIEREGERPEAAIGRLLKNMHQSTRHAVEDSLRRERIDLTFAHFVALHGLDAEPGLAGAELARRVFVTAQTMNTILHRLEKDGAIERRPNPSNQRADSWYITKSGRTSMERARVVAESVWSQMFAALKPTEVIQLQRLLERCLGGFEQRLLDARGAKSKIKSKAAVAKTRRR